MTNRVKKDNLNITGSQIFLQNVKTKPKKEKGQMKTKFIYSSILLLVVTGLFLGFTTSENPKTLLTRTGNGTEKIVSGPQGGPVDAATFSESFEGVTFPPTGWLKISEVGNVANTWARYTVGGQVIGWNPGFAVVTACPGGQTGVAGVSYGDISANNREWLITPQISNVQSGDSLKFYLRYMVPAYADSFSVFISTTTQTVAAMTTTVMKKRFLGNADTTWVEYSYKLGDFVPNGSNIYVGFKESIMDNLTNGSAFTLDLVRVVPGSTPPANPTTWYEQTSTGVTGQLYGISAPDINNVWACGAGGKVIRTTNGGTWTAASGNLATSDLYAIWAFDANTALVTNSPSATNVFRTTNGGTNWTQVFTQAGGFINAFYFKDANNGIMQGDATGGRWSLWRTTNGGVNWDSTGMNIPSTEAGWTGSLQGIGDVVWFGTNSTKVYKSTNFGTTWTSSPTTGEANGYSIWFNDANNGYVGGTTMQKTTNGGTNWAAHTVPGTGTIQALTGWKTTNTYFMGRANIVYSTTNNGTNWNTVFTAAGTSQIWNFTVSRTGSPYVYGCRANGTIVKYGGSATGISPVTTIADSYSLSQNYPNPFNPSTSIKFALPTAGFTSLKVYNMLGKEVATLVSSNLSAGTYSFDFNASNLSSGVYFYKLEAGNFSEVKKMSLIK